MRARCVEPAGLFDQSLFFEALQHCLAVDASNLLNARAGEWLPVGDDGERLVRRGRKTRRVLWSQDATDHVRLRRVGYQLELVLVPLQKETAAGRRFRQGRSVGRRPSSFSAGETCSIPTGACPGGGNRSSTCRNALASASRLTCTRACGITSGSSSPAKVKRPLAWRRISDSASSLKRLYSSRRPLIASSQAVRSSSSPTAASA